MIQTQVTGALQQSQKSDNLSEETPCAIFNANLHININLKKPCCTEMHPSDQRFKEANKWNVTVK